MTSFDEEVEKEEKISNPFNESFGDENILPTLTRGHVILEEEKDNDKILQEDDINIQKDIYSLINQGVKEGTEQVTSMLNKDIVEEIKSSNDKLDEIINETKKKVNKPLSMNKFPHIKAFNTDGMTEQEKRLRRDMIIKIRNYIDCFSDNEIIQSMCGNPVLFKQKLYEKDLAGLTVIYEEILIGINQSKDFEQFMYRVSHKYGNL